MASDRTLEDPSFQTGFVAASYAAGVRGARLLDLFEHPCERAVLLERALAHPDRGERARALAAELTRLVHALEARRLA
jgi:hypothetical protein